MAADDVDRDRDRSAGPTDADAAAVVAMCRSFFCAGRLPADGEADLRKAVLCELDVWWIRGRAAMALEAARLLRNDDDDEGEVTP